MFPYHHLPMGIAILVGTLGTARSLNCLPFLILFKTSISPPPAQILVLSPSLLWAFSLPHSSFLLFRTSHHQCLFPINQFGTSPSLPKSKHFFGKLRGIVPPFGRCAIFLSYSYPSPGCVPTLSCCCGIHKSSDSCIVGGKKRPRLGWNWPVRHQAAWAPA